MVRTCLHHARTRSAGAVSISLLGGTSAGGEGKSRSCALRIAERAPIARTNSRSDRLTVRYERRADIHEAFVLLGCALICWNYVQW